MDATHWSVAIITPHRYDAQLIADLLRNANVPRPRIFADGEAALAYAAQTAVDVLITALDAKPNDGLAWVMALRRSRASRSRQAAVFLLTRTLTPSVAEACRRAGANAVIGLPVSGSTLMGTITKVLAKPRPFVEADGYVGPCRRAGIVTAGAGSRRRRTDRVDAA
ncbi:MAG: hypothetical protein HXY28_14735 [Hydrogenophilaceae bacterium]|jgi:DNA-binding NarL/FixJ family response regulator|nr:hypothetical protein [Hydrogenophilaceae bacterium]